MTVRRLGLLAAAFLVVTVVPWTARPARPHPPHPHRTTTTAPTVTTVAPTTTEPMGTSTTVRTTLPSGPVTINTGGTYRGWWRSTDPGTPAVTIATTQPVVIDRSLIDHAGFGIFAQATVSTNVTVTNTRLRGLDPGSVLEARAVYLLQPASFTFEHNFLVDGQGVLVNGNDTSATITIRYNDYLDIGRWGSDTLIGAVHFDQVLAPDALVAWNRVTNHYGRSMTEDVIGIHESSGTSGHPIVIEHNLIDGSYPRSGNGSDFTGGGIDLGDGDTGGSYQMSRFNTVVRVTNNSLMIPGGDHLEHHDNVAITSGLADDGTRVSSTFGNGLNLWDNPGYTNTPSVVSIHDTTGDHRRWTGSAWERSWQNTPACDPSTACDTQTHLNLALTTDSAWTTAITDAIADWGADVASNSVTIGPLP